MFSTACLFAASQLLTFAFGAPIGSDAKTARSLVERSGYKAFGGDGTPGQGWPTKSQWMPFEELWTANEEAMSTACAQFGQENNSKEENANIKKAIVSVAAEANMQPEVLLAFMMQETKGCVRAPTTNYGHNNPGLLQSFNGKFSCNSDGVGTVPCPAETITGMIRDGAGIGCAFGLKQAFEKTGAGDVSKYYKGARIYNSGSIASSGNLGDGVATHCYASDLANRLLGWCGHSACDEASIASVGAGTPVVGDANVDEPEEHTEEPQEQPEKPTSSPATDDSHVSAPRASGAAANCSQWYVIKSSDTCASTGIALSKLRELNRGLDEKCSNLWVGSAYCTAA